MRGQVAQLSDDIEQQCRVGDERAGWVCRRCVGSVDPVGDVDAGKDPIVGAILENISRRHGRQTKSVDEESLEFTFREMECYHDEREGL